MNKKIIDSCELKEYFSNNGYNCLSPHLIVENNDTVFVTAGIQPILSNYREEQIHNSKKIYLSQPVIRTQFADSVSEGNSIAFTNLTLAGFDISKEEHNNLVKDCLELFCRLGLDPKKIDFKIKDYQREWGDLLVSGEKTFYYYNNIELGDTTFFTKLLENGKDIGIKTMSDVGFGIERVRWCLNNESYFNLYSNSSRIGAKERAYLSAMALLAVNNVEPSNKNAGYRARLFSKKLVEQLDGKELNTDMKEYLSECVNYWKNWQEVDNEINVDNIYNEYIRNSNRYIIEKLTHEGYQNLAGININVSRPEFIKRVISSGLDKEKVYEFFEDNELIIKRKNEMKNKKRKAILEIEDER